MFLIACFIFLLYLKEKNIANNFWIKKSALCVWAVCYSKSILLRSPFSRSSLIFSIKRFALRKT